MLKKFFAAFFALIVGMCMLAFIVSVLSPSTPESSVSQESDSSTLSDPATESEEPPQQVYTIGDTFTLGATTWTINDSRVQESAEANYSQAIASGKFVVFDVTIANGDSEARTIPMAKAFDDQGREFETVGFEAAIAFDNTCSIDRLNPDQSITCVYVYDVAEALQQLCLRAEEMVVFGAETADVCVRLP